MVTLNESYHQALAELMQDQGRRKKLAKASSPPQRPPKKPQQQKQQQEEVAKLNLTDEDAVAPKKATKTFQLFIAHLQPKRKPPLRVQLLRRLYKRRKRLESDLSKLPRIRPSRVWSVI